jgi:dephospho-CoA kinase
MALKNQNNNSSKLGSLVFGDETKRKTLNKIVHPAIQKKLVGNV